MKTKTLIETINRILEYKRQLYAKSQDTTERIGIMNYIHALEFVLEQLEKK